jgi:phosphatidylglycerol:prolipoprotein diacylglycerol transferase
MTTVYPFIIRIGPIEITGFGLMMMIGFMVGGWIIDRDLRRRGFNPDFAADIIVAAVVGGVVGAKLWYVGLHGTQALFSRGGLVWYGGFICASLAVILQGIRRKVPFRWNAQLVAPALPAAYALGRIGCLMVGDDYGRPTTLPWGLAFPQGLPPTTAGGMAEFGYVAPAGTDPTTLMAVHPTQLYEIGLMTIAFMVIWKLRDRPLGTGWLFGFYLVLAGAERFLVEFFRLKDDRFFGTFTLAQFTSIALIVTGMALIAVFAGKGRPDPGPYLSGKPAH